MVSDSSGMDLLPVIGLLGAALATAPLFKRIGLGSVLGYLAGGVIIGPFGMKIISDPSSILHVAELGVVMFLFVIGLEMRPARLWGLRFEIFGLGVVQVGICVLCLTAVGVFTGFPVAPSFVAGAGFVLTSTAIVMQLLQERREMATPTGQQMISILLLEDLAIVPLLALVTFLAPIIPGSATSREGFDWLAVTLGTASIATLVLAGRLLLNPLFGFIANAQAREVMTAAALMVVLGSAFVMQLGGLSMAMGAFLAGVLLSESTFRHQLEADIEPFRGILLGLFFLAVGMSLDLGVIAVNWRTILFYVVAYMAVKALVIYLVARLFKSSNQEAIVRAVLMAQGGEFAFVLYAAALSAGIITKEQSAILTAIIIVSMVATPVMILTLKITRKEGAETVGIGLRPQDLRGTVLVIGFGRFGQIVSQLLLAQGHRISLIDTDVEMINVAREFAFKVYYGDGTRLDILHAAGVEHARAVVVCIDNTNDATRIVQLLQAEFPLTPVLARAADRRHALELVEAGTAFHVRETFESAMVLGQKTLEILGASPDQAEHVVQGLRHRDEQRFQLERAGGLSAGHVLFSGTVNPVEIVHEKPDGLGSIVPVQQEV